jgi:hypothetical protein
MEHYITSISYHDEPFVLQDGHKLTLRYILEHPGEIVFDLVGAVPEGDWEVKRKESAFLTIFVNS